MSRLTLTLLISCSISQFAFAEPRGDSTRGKALFTTCAACHGPQGHGMQALNSPAIAGQEAWYLTRQLKNFKSGIRGSHPKDTYGAQMRPMAMTLADDQAVSDVVAYIISLPQPPKEEGVSGDPKTGAATYVTCAACHGAKGEGNQTLNAPRLTGLPSWYIKRQLENYKEGIRGADTKDSYGMQMRPMAMTVPPEQTDNLIAYIKSL